MQIEHQSLKVNDRSSIGARVKAVLLRVIALAVGAALVAGAFVVSIVFFAVALAIALVVLGYLWWRTRHLRRQMRQQFNARAAAERDVIEGTVLKSE